MSTYSFVNVREVTPYFPRWECIIGVYMVHYGDIVNHHG
jgi:hypothetical protein